MIKTLHEKTELSSEGKTLLVITGDFHNYGKEYDEAKRFINQLVDAMNLDISEDVFVVPGNHDKAYSDEDKARKVQTSIIKVVQKDYTELQDNVTIDLLLEPFELYNRFCKELKIYKEGESIPATVHVRTWRNKLNIIHLNTALIADGKIKKDQVVDINTLTSESFTESIPDIYPAIAIGHNDFFDLKDRIQTEITPVFDRKNVCAYLCGDKHKFTQKRRNKHISLRSGYNDRSIPNIVCGKCTTDEDDNYSDFGFFIHCWDEKKGIVNLERYTWDDKNEQNKFFLCVESKAYSLMNIDVCSYITYDFPNRLYILYNEDGMMRCLYTLFKAPVYDGQYNSGVLSLLAIIQDEYKKLYDQFYANSEVEEKVGFDRILSDKNVVRIEHSISTDPLIVTYLLFIRAEGKYFTNDYDGAIHDYMEAYKKIYIQYQNMAMPEIEKQRCAYLMNSIAWAYKCRKQKNDCEIAIKWYNKLFDEFSNIEEYFSSWKYRMNYGVCLEETQRYIEAIEQYGKAIEQFEKAIGKEYIVSDKERVHEYRIYLKYCSAMLKYWDLITGKTSGCWIERTKAIYNKKDEYLNDQVLGIIDKNLALAEFRQGKRDKKELAPEYHNQIINILTYKMIINSGNGDIGEYKKEIYDSLEMLKTFDEKTDPGKHYVMRDFYYALYEISNSMKEKEESFLRAWEENELINGDGDALLFKNMLMTKKSGTHFYVTSRQKEEKND